MIEVWPNIWKSYLAIFCTIVLTLIIVISIFCQVYDHKHSFGVSHFDVINSVFVYCEDYVMSSRSCINYYNSVSVLGVLYNIIIILTFLRLRMLLMDLGWYHTLPWLFKFPCWFVVDKHPLVISFNVVGTVLILVRYLDSPNISVVDSLSSKIHFFITYLFSCWWHLRPLIWTYCSPLQQFDL